MSRPALEKSMRNPATGSRPLILNRF